ncbi:Purine biosynthesis 4 [Hibiscus syriacus]|uniref:Purine biosynthesis 4 n=1 Tax=Hibiscus syriacus TaxID=106335 RepID=A0A6A3AE59_HIBSY|nr:Purine biosynthesis 4 [Hibiscus syriacus]
MFFGLGLVTSQFINELIKKSVQQARHETCALLEMCDSHGWPSSHSQYMFFTVYFTLLTCKGIGGIWKVRTKWAALFLPWSLAVLTLYSGFILVTILWLKFLQELLWVLFLDTSHIQGVLKFEYDNARAARTGMLPEKPWLPRAVEYS